ncbi:MAG: MlaE family ABC transporter permease [Planctomycetota bacterium]|jgi:phospholipid/cholesterol/gamma-HCH transport system permease protein
MTMMAEFASHAGFTARLLFRALACAVRKPRIRMTVDIMYDYGIKSLPVVAIVALFSGMIISLQTGIQLVRFGQEEFIGIVVAQSFAREFGPFMTCIILVGTVVSAYAAELGTMSVSEETAALEVMSIDPVGYLAAPRIIALTIMTFLLTICADAIGLVGGGLVAKTQLSVPLNRYFENALDSLYGREWIGLPKDLYGGLVKSAIMGCVIAAIGCAEGLTAQGGALGVGRSVRRAVIASIVMILVLSFILTWLFYRAFAT